MIRGPPKRTKQPAKRAKLTKIAPKKKVTFNLSKVVDLGRTPFPKLIKNQIVAYATASVTTSAGGFAAVQVLANGAYQPYANIVGSSTIQPLYFDQLMAIYNHYAVVSSFIEFTLLPPSTGATQGQFQVAAYIDDDTTAATTVASAAQRPGARVAYFNQQAQGVPTLTLGWSSLATFGNDKPWTDPELQGNVAANPVEQSLYTFAFQNPVAGAVAHEIAIKVTFNVVWDELKTIALS